MAVAEPNWSGSEEDHAFRSQAIQWLLHQEPQLRQGRTRGRAIPRTIIQYWHDLDALPGDVLECLDSWRSLEGCGFERLLFDDARARRFIAEHYATKYVDAFDLCYHPAMRCDYVRLCYVFRCGGFYVDADEVYQGAPCDALFRDDTIKMQPLCYDRLTDEMVPPEDFLTDVTSPSRRIFYVDNNPIVVPPGHALVRLALRRSTRLLLRRTERPEIQSTTGPGNLSASLVRHMSRLRRVRRDWDFVLLRDWSTVSACRWLLGYRKDERNWRLLRTRGTE